MPWGLCMITHNNIDYEFKMCRRDSFHISDVKGKGKGSCLESRLHDNACSKEFTFPLARWVPMQPATIDSTLDLCTRYPLRPGSVEYEVCQTPLHMASTGNQTPDLLILSPTPYPPGHMLPLVKCMLIDYVS